MPGPTGPLALLGSGEFEPWTNAVDRLLLETANGDGSVALFPTASAPEGETYTDWAEKGLRHYQRLGVRSRVIEVRGREDADRSDLARELDRVSLIFFSGGDPAFLGRVFEGTAVWASVVEAVARGAAFAGCSAGACVAGAFAPDSMTEHIWSDRWRAGLGLLPDVWVLPHFDGLAPDVRGYFLSAIPTGATILGVDEQTAVVRIGSTWTVIGDGGAFIRRGDVALRAGVGCSFDLESTQPGSGRPVDPQLVAALDPLPAGAGSIGVLSSEEFSDASRDVDLSMLETAGPAVGVVLAGDPSNAARVGHEALEHYRRLGAEPRIVGPVDDPGDLDIVFLAGGDPSRLVAALDGSPLWGSALYRWNAGMALAGSSAGAMALSERCLLPEPGADLPTSWGRGLGPLRSVAFAVHASSRPVGWLEGAAETAPVPLLSLDDDVGIVIRPGAPLEVFGGGTIRLEAAGAGRVAPPEGAPMVRLYHRTPHADDIIAHGFVDSTVNPVRDGAWEGTWFSDTPLPVTDGVEGGTVLVLELPADVADGYRWQDPAKPFAEFVLPAHVANRYGPPLVHRPDGTNRDAVTNAAERERWRRDPEETA
jgi:cyanophycinase-like exopeptidase